MQTVKCRLFNSRLNPRRTKLEIPGWAGKPEPRRDGSHEHPWHCVPFTEGETSVIGVMPGKIITEHRRFSLPSKGNPSPDMNVDTDAEIEDAASKLSRRGIGLTIKSSRTLLIVGVTTADGRVR